MPLMQAVKQYFGYDDNMQLLKEWKELDPDSKAEIKAGLEQRGYVIDAPKAAA